MTMACDSGQLGTILYKCRVNSHLSGTMSLLHPCMYVGMKHSTHPVYTERALSVGLLPHLTSHTSLSPFRLPRGLFCPSCILRECCPRFCHCEGASESVLASQCDSGFLSQGYGSHYLTKDHPRKRRVDRLDLQSKSSRRIALGRMAGVILLL